ncbi:MAG: GNAT family N-acetyltransferase, partial [Spirochaetota bacterium]
MDKTVYHISVSDVDDWFLKEVFAIMDDVWPPKENKIIPFAKRKNDYLSKYHDGHLFVMKHHGRIVSHAGIFPRQITVGKIPCDINALASVCVLKEHQGNQLGAAIVRHTFDFIMKSTIPRTLYQTGV